VRTRLSYSNVTATLALIVAVGGGTVAVAGSLPGRNSVNSGDIKNHQVKKPDIARGLLPTGKATGVLEPTAATDTITSTELKLKRKARLLVLGRTLVIGLSCPGSCTHEVGLFVDGDAVPHSGETLAVPAASQTHVFVFGITSKLPAGTHRVALKGGTLVGTPTVNDANYELAAIPLSG
jgi:hypothetical protein